MTADRTDAVLASIDGALADEEIPDGMRWSPAPETVTDAPEPYDGDRVWVPPQHYEDPVSSHDGTPVPIGADFPQVGTVRGGLLLTRASPHAWQPVGYTDYRPRPVSPPPLHITVQREPPALIVEDRSNGMAIARPLTGDEVSAVFRGVLDGLVAAVRPLVTELGRVFTTLSESLRGAGVVPPEPPVDPRAAALAHRRALGTGPARPGPERSRAPRRLR